MSPAHDPFLLLSLRSSTVIFMTHNYTELLLRLLLLSIFHFVSFCHLKSNVTSYDFYFLVFLISFRFSSINFPLHFLTVFSSSSSISFLYIITLSPILSTSSHVSSSFLSFSLSQASLSSTFFHLHMRSLPLTSSRSQSLLGRGAEEGDIIHFGVGTNQSATDSSKLCHETDLPTRIRR